MGQVNDNRLSYKCLDDPFLFPPVSLGCEVTGRSCRGQAGQTACKPGSVEDGHSSRTRVTARLVRPARTEAETPSACRQATPSLFGLAPGGVYRAVSVAGDAVRPYRTVSPLPARKRAGGLFSAALSLESPPPGVTRHRVSVEPGLSSPGGNPGGDHPAVWQWDSMGPAGPGQGRPSRRTPMVAPMAQIPPPQPPRPTSSEFERPPGAACPRHRPMIDSANCSTSFHSGSH